MAFISLSRNFGKENAMLAGFDHASGDCVIILDADLQHPPALIPDMLHLGRREHRTSMRGETSPARVGCAAV